MIAFHTLDHRDLLFRDIRELKEQIEEFDLKISRILKTNFHTVYIRPPMGIINWWLLGDLVKCGHKILFVTHNPGDTFISEEGSQVYIQNLIAEIRAQDGGIIVLHNGVELVPKPGPDDYYNQKSPADREWLLKEVDELIKKMKSDGFEFILEW